MRSKFSLGIVCLLILALPMIIIVALRQTRLSSKANFSALAYSGISCTDSDVTASYPKGNNPYFKGTATVTYNTGGKNSQTDYCIDTSHLIELTCGRSPAVGYTTYTNYQACPANYKCFDGKCGDCPNNGCFTGKGACVTNNYLIRTSQAPAPPYITGSWAVDNINTRQCYNKNWCSGCLTGNNCCVNNGKIISPNETPNTKDYPSGCWNPQNNTRVCSGGSFATYPKTVNVLSLSYIPIINGQVNTITTGTTDPSLANLRIKISNDTDLLKSLLENGTRYHLKSNSTSINALQYNILERKEFLKPVPNSVTFMPTADHFRILQGDVNICNYVDNLGVKEVWLWMYHTSAVTPIESNMAMGNKSRAYWNYGNYGDVSNSHYDNDLPVCQNTYVVYNYNYAREIGTMMENHVHQIERTLGWVDSSIYNRLFEGSAGAQPFYRCGNAHCPPNTMSNCIPSHQYDWCSQTSVQSDCADWRPTVAGGTRTAVSSTSWGANDNTWPLNCKIGERYFQWWMQNLPGPGNNLKTDDGRTLRDWWDFTADWDGALLSGKYLAR